MDYKKYNDYYLIDMVRENDCFSRDILYRKYQPILKSISKDFYQRFKDYGYEYEDFLQEANVLFEKALINYKDNQNSLFYTFVDICVKRGMMTFCRNISNTKIKIYYTDLDQFNVKDEKNNINSFSYEYDGNKLVTEIISKLPIEYSSVLELKMNGFNYREISTLLDIPSSTVEYRIRRIRKEINQYYCQEAI